MNAKVSALLLTGLLLLMIAAAWAQSSVTAPPTCPPLEDKILQDLLQPTAWVRANWNMNTSRWDVDCTQIEAFANATAPAYNATSNAVYNSPNSIPRSRGNSNYVNTDPYNFLRNINANANMPARNANTARPPRSVRREPNTRRPGN